MSPLSPNPYVQANTNGRLHDGREPTLAPVNRGYLYGDAIYEVWRTYDRVIFAWDEHWRRLLNSAGAISLEIPWNQADMLGEVKTTVAAFREQTNWSGDMYIRLQIYRGEGEISLSIQPSLNPGYTILVKPVPELSAAALQDGLTLTVARNVRRNPKQALDPAWKTGNYLNNITGLAEARQRGADDVVFLNLAGEVTEASTSNIAFIRDRTFVTPPLAAGILPGITRSIVLQEVAQSTGLTAVEETVQPGELGDFDEAILLSTTKDIQPVSSIDEIRFRTGEGTRSRQLKRAFADYARAHTQAHPDRAV